MGDFEEPQKEELEKEMVFVVARYLNDRDATTVILGVFRDQDKAKAFAFDNQYSDEVSVTPFELS